MWGVIYTTCSLRFYASTSRLTGKSTGAYLGQEEEAKICSPYWARSLYALVYPLVTRHCLRLNVQILSFFLFFFPFFYKTFSTSGSADYLQYSKSIKPFFGPTIYPVLPLMSVYFLPVAYTVLYLWYGSVMAGENVPEYHGIRRSLSWRWACKRACTREPHKSL